MHYLLVSVTEYMFQRNDVHTKYWIMNHALYIVLRTLCSRLQEKGKAKITLCGWDLGLHAISRWLNYTLQMLKA